MTNAWAGGKVAIRGGAPRRTPRESAAALIAVRPISENAGELGWIRASEEALDRLFGMPAALLCRTLFWRADEAACGWRLPQCSDWHAKCLATSGLTWPGTRVRRPPGAGRQTSDFKASVF